MGVLEAYKRQSVFGGWTRVEMLLQIYDRAISSVEGCKIASVNHDATAYAKNLIDAQKAILAIHSGLKPDEHDVAYNIARLLHFVLVSIEKKDFDGAGKVLLGLREGFAAVADEANQLERDGEIPAMPSDDSFRSMA